MLLEVNDVHKSHARGAQEVKALRGVSLSIDRGEFVSIVGPSGSGKSTLMHIIGGLDRATSGSVRLAGSDIDAYSDRQLSEFRRRKLGFVFQFFHLLPMLTAEENVALPLLLDGASPAAALPKARALLQTVGLGVRLDHRPDQLSGGEMQRAAIARALVADPLLVLADEPTGNLDSATGWEVLSLLREQVRTRMHTVIMVTHDPRAAAFGTRTVALRDGRVESDAPPSSVVAFERPTGTAEC